MTLFEDWPAPDTVAGPALSKTNAGRRLGIGLDAVESLIRRTRLGTARIPFPAPDGRAVNPDTPRRHYVPWWWESTIVAYGIAAGTLDPDGNLRHPPAN